MFELSTFTPAEAAKISGVSVTLQRDWRRRDILPKEQGHARFDVFAVANLMALDRLAQRGIGPQQAQAVSEFIAVGIVASVLKWYRAAFDGPLERLNSPLIWDGRELEIVSQPHRDLAYDAWFFRANWLTKQLLLKRGYASRDLAEYFIWWANGAHEMAGGDGWIQQVVDADDERTKGAVIVLPLLALGRELFRKADRPLVKVTLSETWMGKAPGALADISPEDALREVLESQAWGK